MRTYRKSNTVSAKLALKYNKAQSITRLTRRWLWAIYQKPMNRKTLLYKRKVQPIQVKRALAHINANNMFTGRDGKFT